MDAFAETTVLLQAALNLNLMQISTICSGGTLFLYLTTRSTELCLVCKFAFFEFGVTPGDGVNRGGQPPPPLDASAGFR